MEARHFLNGLMKAQRTRRQCLLRPFVSSHLSHTAPSNRYLATNSQLNASPDTKTNSDATPLSHSTRDTRSDSTKRPSQPFSPRTNRSNGRSGESLSEVDSILRAISDNSVGRPSAMTRTTPPKAPSWSEDITSLLNMYERHTPTRSNAAKQKAIEMRLTPALGRSVTVDMVRGFDVSRAIAMMERNLNGNGVRQQVREQKYHVRRGQLRKEMKMKQWRKIFMAGFKATCSRCQKLVKQGW